MCVVIGNVKIYGGERGIRTPGTLSGTAAVQPPVKSDFTMLSRGGLQYYNASWQLPASLERGVSSKQRHVLLCTRSNLGGRQCFLT